MSSSIDHDKEYNPDVVYAAADGIVGESTNIDSKREDREAAESEISGKIPQSELNDLRSAGDEVFEKRTRGRGEQNDAYKHERDLDEALRQEGAI